jgi:hypothetical protein
MQVKTDTDWRRADEAAATTPRAFCPERGCARRVAALDGGGFRCARHGSVAEPRWQVEKLAALRLVAEEAFEQARGDLSFAPFRMAGYAARRLVEERFGIPADSVSIEHNGDWGAALRTLGERSPETRAKLNLYMEPRGLGYEPHTYRMVRFGTAAVRGYVSDWHAPDLTLPEASGAGFSTYVDTSGPEDRFSGVLLIEKEGLLPVVQAAGIGERFDLMVAATAGHGVTAVKEFVEELAGAFPGVRVYVLHDFDIDGVLIGNLGRDTKSWTWSLDADVVDLGLTLADVAELGVLDESVRGRKDMRPVLREYGCTAEEIDYLVAATFEKDADGMVWSGRRAELNGLIGRKFIEFIEAKLEAQPGVAKVVPDDDRLAVAYRRARFIHMVNEAIEQAADEAMAAVGEFDVPADLSARVRDLLEDRPSWSWDDAVAALAKEADGA